MRLVTGIALIDRGVTSLSAGKMHFAVLSLLTTAAGLLLVAGLWTPIAGTLVAVIELRNMFLHVGDPWMYLLLATLSAALAMLGPGAWSVDARLFGWKRLDIRPRNSQG
jgi:uncharacterized membrane protein YphA (DoxX/SURF4 family)